MMGSSCRAVNISCPVSVTKIVSVVGDGGFVWVCVFGRAYVCSFVRGVRGEDKDHYEGWRAWVCVRKKGGK